MRSESFDINNFSVSDAGNYMLGHYHPYMNNLLQVNRELLYTVAKEKESFAEVVQLFNRLEKQVLEHIILERMLLEQALNLEKNTTAATASPQLVKADELKFDHIRIMEILSALRDKCNNYHSNTTDPAILKLCFAKLYNLEQDLRKHIYIEDNILFPRILKYTMKV